MAGQGRANVLLVHVDEQPHSALACYGNRRAHTNSIDRLALQGCRFGNCFSQSLDWADSCLSLLSGQYPSRAQNGQTQILLSRILRAYGYYCAAFGAVHLHQRSAHWHDPTLNGFDQAELTSGFGQEDAYLAHLKIRAPECVTAVAQALADGGRRPLPPDCTVNAFSTLRAISVMQQQAKAGQPFFCVLGLRAFESPMLAPQRYLSLYDPARLPIPVQASCRDLDEAQLRAHEQNYFACVSEIDAMLGNALQELERLQVAHNTVVIYTAGRGRYAQRALDNCSATLADIMTHVPLLVRGPADLVHSDLVANTIVELVDVAPTLLELLRIQVPPGMQGRSFRAVLAAESRQHRTTAITELPNGRLLRSPNFGYAIRADGTETMYDPSSADQSSNLAANIRYRGVVSEERRQLLARMVDAADDSNGRGFPT